TDPVPALDDRVLVIISTVGPERTTIVTLDEKLQMRSVYDSGGSPAQSHFPPLGSIYQVKVVGAGKLLLQERRLPGENVNTLSNRSFLLTINHGEISL